MDPFIESKSIGYKLFGSKLILQHQAIINDPNLMKEIFITDLDTFQKTNLAKELFDDLAGGLILAQNGEEWHRARKLFQPAFNPSNLQQGFKISLERANALLEVRMMLQCYNPKKIDEFATSGKPFDIQALVLRFTFDVIGLIGFGAEFKAIERYFPNLL